MGVIAGARAGKCKLGARAGKHKLGARTGKYKLGARANKYKLGARAGKYKLGPGLGAEAADRARTGGQAKSWEPGNTKTQDKVIHATLHKRTVTLLTLAQKQCLVLTTEPTYSIDRWSIHGIPSGPNPTKYHYY